MQRNFNRNDITHTTDLISDLKRFLESSEYTQIFLLTDTNCFKLCYPLIRNAFGEDDDIKIFTIVAEEKNKTLETVSEIWNFLFANEADRDSVLINLGGGIVTDTGGFAASTFKRGISFVNIPTSLLAQVDASSGGKTGINFKGLKNQIGTITLPDKIFISTAFLKTLTKKEFLSGFGEMLKHALIFDKNHFKELQNFIKKDFLVGNYQNLDSLISKSVKIKTHFVKNDISEKGIRKTLNFGHTFGHAFESYFNQTDKPLKHGAAIAYGMICDLHLSVIKKGFDKKTFLEISDLILNIYSGIQIPKNDYYTIYNYMVHDKKNTHKTIRTVLLTDIGLPDYKVIINKEEIFENLEKLNKLSKDFNTI